MNKELPLAAPDEWDCASYRPHSRVWPTFQCPDWVMWGAVQYRVLSQEALSGVTAVRSLGLALPVCP